MNPPRKPDHDVEPIFPARWSPRAMSKEPLSREELASLFEAARWAPSSFNNQPWRFMYAHRGTRVWDTFVGFLGEYNRTWAQNAAVLIVVASKGTFDRNGKPSRTHSFDTGAAWQSIALQASIKGWVAHGMEGFDYDKAKSELHIPNDHTVEAMLAIGKPGRKEDLPAALQEREAPSPRKPIEEFAFEGEFQAQKEEPS